MQTSDSLPFIEPWIDTTGWDIRDFENVRTPCYVVSESHLEQNLVILDKVQKTTGCKILAALKGFSMYAMFPMMRPYLAGAEASSVNEARLGAEEFGKEIHVFSPSYTKENIHDYIKYADHLVFNSFSQWNRFKDVIKQQPKHISCGIRVNPEHSETETPMYDPGSPDSHFGVPVRNFEANNLQGIEGLHFHNLCELNADALQRTLVAFEQKFGKYLKDMLWVNFGGGHHITRADYNIDLLCDIIKGFKSRYPHIEIYLEPGEAIALNAGVLVASVVDIFCKDSSADGKTRQFAVLDVSATTHMPDVLEMPYRPTILGANPYSETANLYRLVGPTCLTGDVIGTYSFPATLAIGQKLVFMNMAIYTMVKNHTFNGIDLPDIAVLHPDNGIEVIRSFGYQDFKGRLS